MPEREIEKLSSKTAPAYPAAMMLMQKKLFSFFYFVDFTTATTTTTTKINRHSFFSTFIAISVQKWVKEQIGRIAKLCKMSVIVLFYITEKNVCFKFVLFFV